MNCPTTRAAASIVAATMSMALLLGACGSGSDPAALDVLTENVPSLTEGELYVSDSGDGSCRTDCPPPTISRGWVIDCADAEAARQTFAGQLEAAGFTDDGGDEFSATIDDVAITLNVSSYTDAGDGPAPTEEPFAADPSLLDGQCALFTLAVAQ